VPETYISLAKLIGKEPHRQVADAIWPWRQQLKQEFVIETRPGAGGIARYD
jgi:hypothetical protein